MRKIHDMVEPFCSLGTLQRESASTCSLLLVLGILGGLDSSALEVCVNSLLSKLAVDLDGLHILGQRLDLASLGDLWKSEHTSGSVLRGGFDLLGGGVVDLALLDLTLVSWEQDELGLIIGQSLDIRVLHVSVLVVSSVVNGNSDRLSESWGELGSLKLLQSEASSELNLAGILSSLAMNEWSKLGNWSWERSLCFRLSSLESDLLVGSLVEEASNSSLPMLSQMRALKDIIVFYHVAN